MDTRRLPPQGGAFDGGVGWPAVGRRRIRVRHLGEFVDSAVKGVVGVASGLGQVLAARGSGWFTGPGFYAVAAVVGPDPLHP